MAASVGATDIGFVHRRTPAADLYFVVNTSNVRRAFDATVRLVASEAQQWNPVTGDVAPVAVRVAARRSGATVALDLAPYESTVVVFPKVPGTARPQAVPGHRAALALAPIDISADWRVTFGSEKSSAVWPSLRSWTEDESKRFYSGVAVYEKTVVVPAAMLRSGQSVVLDLGTPKPMEVGGPRGRFQAWIDAPVREAAVVSVNGHRAGSVWCPPFALDVTALLRPGPNTVRIEAANLAVNYMAGHALPDDRLLNLRYGRRFDPQDMDKVQPMPAGLFGPIRLVPVAPPTRP
jgi:hypothetical protein